MQQVVKITGVFENHGENAKGPWTRYDVKTAGGTKFQTFDDTLGATATGLKGQQAEVEYTVEQRGQYENNVLKAIKPAEGAVNAPAQQSAPASQDEFRRSKEEMRLTEAVKAAATIVASFDGDQKTVANLFVLAEQISERLGGKPTDDGPKF